MDAELQKQIEERFIFYREDPEGWCYFAEEVLGSILDDEQKKILNSVKVNKMTSVASGTARGKDYISAVACMCFMYLTPVWNEKSELVENTKIAMTAPTGRQVYNIMVPEIRRLYRKAGERGFPLPGRLTGNDIRTDWEEWFMTGFKADDHNHEAWTGFHAANTMFVVTEASGIPEGTFSAIEGNLQGNSRILIVFNPNTNTGYAAKSQKSPRWAKFRLNSLNAPNVVLKKDIIPGQVDYAWVKDKVETWCQRIPSEDFKESEDDFKWEGGVYRPNDLFRMKVLGKFPKVSTDTLIPLFWIELANERWKEFHKTPSAERMYSSESRIGVDVAGMGRDDSVICDRRDNIVKEFKNFNSAGVADHMKVAGMTVNMMKNVLYPIAFIDTIGEGAGVYSRLSELKYAGKESLTKYGYERAISAKNSTAAKDDKGKPLEDFTGEYTFANMRAYMHWAVRDWLNPDNNQNAMLPPDDVFAQEATEIKYSFRSNGDIIIEPKEDIIERLGHSPDKFDSLALTFYPARIKKNHVENTQPKTKSSLGFY
ncbi:hypothetical protein [Sphingobacterium yanglingense]|uniref:Phage terminase large subunit-like protein n=1 Tax=Sphingobacterium yanglingense TaxID=1437280 RepID=A0A4R6WHF2_9SPHI|nr:hypothetical protein [Sphingobacterium yanglingense]TDQ79564.1 hypothetical protein CLV99_1007 [Sphingobacterium yanglingense]